jgi:hypothetical protein
MIEHEQKTVSPVESGGRQELLRNAARVGPGYRGKREVASEGQRMQIALDLRNFGIEPPSYLTNPTQWVDRNAKLFEAGEYPDKGISVTTEDLATIEQNFDLPVPVLIEHADSPLQMGFLTSVTARGKELFGVLAMTKEADALLTASGATGLSVGLEKDLSKIREVSVVRNPRVKSARLFCESPDFEAHFTDVDYSTQFLEQQQSLRTEMAKMSVSEFVKQGKICPAQREFAETIMASEHVAAMQAFILNQPKSSLFNAPTMTPKSSESDLLMPEVAAFYRKHFPGIDLTEIATKR